MTDPTNHEPPEWPPDYASELDNRNYACILLPRLDYDAQLRAIHDLLQRHREATSALTEQISEIGTYARQSTGWRNLQATEEWLERMHASVYQDAAHSMAAVGMLAPFVESIFHQALLGVREHIPSGHVQNHPRWQHRGKELWDCHYVWNGSKWTKNLVAGIFDLADAVGLASHLPSDLRQRLEALFGYRNRMFHNGFEWPMEQRRKFANCKRDWPDHWFRAAESDMVPWIFYMTDEFVIECVGAIEQVIESIGVFAQNLANGGAAQQADAMDQPSAGR